MHLSLSNRKTLAVLSLSFSLLSSCLYAQTGGQNAYYFPNASSASSVQAQPVLAPTYADPSQPAANNAAQMGTVNDPARLRVTALTTSTPTPNETYELNDARPPVTAQTRYYPAAVGAQPSSATTAYPSHQYVDRPYQAPARQALPVATTLAPPPPTMPLGTRAGLDVGIQGSYYRYRESSLDVTSLGGMLGFTGSGTIVFPRSWFATIDGRFAFAPGGTDYRGSGTESGEETTQWEVRALAGRDFAFEYFTLSPYSGLGYRELYNDARGETSTGAEGYRRLNQMVYLPIGVNPRFRVTDETRIAMKVEYDGTLLGIQHSRLGDTGAGNPDLINRQDSGGSGIRAEIMYESQNISIGPFFNYWDIGQSNEKIFSSSSATTCASFSARAPCVLVGYEPRNHTTEAGIQAKYHFY